MTQTKTVLTEDDIEELKRVGHTVGEINNVQQFAEPFCTTGRLYLSRIFVRARLHKKDFDAVMAACREVWVDIWSTGTSDRIGDPDDVTPPSVGLDNTCGYIWVYRKLGMKMPKSLS